MRVEATALGPGIRLLPGGASVLFLDPNETPGCAASASSPASPDGWPASSAISTLFATATCISAAPPSRRCATSPSGGWWPRPTSWPTVPTWPSSSAGLVQRALLVFRSLRPGWPAMVPHLLELARQELDGRRRWDVAFPRRSGPWPAWTEAGGVRHYGRWDPVRRILTEVAPDADDGLPELRPLLERGGKLVAYRPGQRAVVRVERDEEVRFVKVVSPRRARRFVTRALAASGAAATTPGFPVLAPILDARAERGTIAFGELPGPTLRDLLLAGEADHALPAVAAGR